jgi:hypothetical protein
MVAVDTSGLWDKNTWFRQIKQVEFEQLTTNQAKSIPPTTRFYYSIHSNLTSLPPVNPFDATLLTFYGWTLGTQPDKRVQLEETLR